MKLNYYRQIEESVEVSVEDFIEYCRKDLEKGKFIGGDLLVYIGDNFNELLKEFINSDMENVEPLDSSFDDLYEAIEERLCND